MTGSIWLVINSGGERPENKRTNPSNAEACRILVTLKIAYNADIVSGRRLAEFKQDLGPLNRVAMHQGGGKNYGKEGYREGMLVAAGYYLTSFRLRDIDKNAHRPLYDLMTYYFPSGSFEGIVYFRLHTARQLFPIEELGVRPEPTENLVEIDPGHIGYESLDEWWHNTVSDR